MKNQNDLLSLFEISELCIKLSKSANVKAPDTEQIIQLFQTYNKLKPSIFREAVSRLSKREFYKFPGNGFFETEIQNVKSSIKNENKKYVPKIPEEELATDEDWAELRNKVNKKFNAKIL